MLPAFRSLCIIALGLPAAFAEEPGFRKAVTCDGVYEKHLQGICTDEKDSIFWCFTTALVKTDRDGKVLKKVEVPNHHGDLCFAKGKVYVAVNLGKFSDPEGKGADSWVYVYDADDLSLKSKHEVKDVIYGAGGMAHHEGRFLVIGGLPDGDKENHAYEYDKDFKFVKKHLFECGHTERGIQTAAFAEGYWWFGCYGEPKSLLKADADFKKTTRYEFDCSLGIVPVGAGRFLVAKDIIIEGKGRSGRLELAEPDKDKGLKFIAEPKK